MANSRRRSARVVKSGWVLVVALLALPNCTLDRRGLVTPRNLHKGSVPWDGAVMCDIEVPSSRRCVTELSDAERATAIRLSEAAIALAEGRSSTIGIDESPAAITACGALGQAVTFQGPFPNGLTTCLNCSTIGSIDHPDALSACRAICYDFFGDTLAEGTRTPRVPPSDEVRAFCDGATRVSTNLPAATCVDGVCSEGGMRMDFVDPRQVPEPVIWSQLVGVFAGSPPTNDLTQNVADTVDFAAGAVSEQVITDNDAYVEFSATRSDLSHFLGFTEIPAACGTACMDTSQHYSGISFAILLRLDGRFYVYENGTPITGPDLDGSFGTYMPGDRFRLRLRRNTDGTATLTYAKLVTTCVPGTVCNQLEFFTHSGPAHYPMRVDTSLRHFGATLSDVRLVRVR
jgi:hypothetical protein